MNYSHDGSPIGGLAYGILVKLTNSTLAAVSLALPTILPHGKVTFGDEESPVGNMQSIFYEDLGTSKVVGTLWPSFVQIWLLLAMTSRDGSTSGRKFFHISRICNCRVQWGTGDRFVGAEKKDDDKMRLSYLGEHARGRPNVYGAMNLQICFDLGARRHGEIEP